MIGAKYREILNENLLQIAEDLRLGRRSPSNRTTTLSTQPEPRLEPDRTSLKRPENSCAAMHPIQGDGVREDLQRRM
jgi:hypothetical protein